MTTNSGEHTSLKHSLAHDLRAQGLTVQVDAEIPLRRSDTASGVVAEIGRRVPGAYYENGALHIDGEGLDEAVRQFDADGASRRRIDEATGELLGKVAERQAESEAHAQGRRPTLVTGGNPYAEAIIPRPSAFQDRDGVQTDYTKAPDIERIANALIAECRDLAFLEEVRIRYLWRRKAQNKAGKIVLGTCQKLSGLPQYAIGGGDFLIVINAENCGLKRLKGWQLEALVYHELNHIAPPDEDDPVSVPTLIGHDFEGFGAELQRYGTWHESLAQAAESFEDLPLFGGAR